MAIVPSQSIADSCLEVLLSDTRGVCRVPCVSLNLQLRLAAVAVAVFQWLLKAEIKKKTVNICLLQHYR